MAKNNGAICPTDCEPVTLRELIRRGIEHRDACAIRIALACDSEGYVFRCDNVLCGSRWKSRTERVSELRRKHGLPSEPGVSRLSDKERDTAMNIACMLEYAEILRKKATELGDEVFGEPAPEPEEPAASNGKPKEQPGDDSAVAWLGGLAGQRKPEQAEEPAPVSLPATADQPKAPKADEGELETAIRKAFVTHREAWPSECIKIGEGATLHRRGDEIVLHESGKRPVVVGWLSRTGWLVDDDLSEKLMRTPQPRDPLLETPATGIVEELLNAIEGFSDAELTRAAEEAEAGGNQVLTRIGKFYLEIHLVHLRSTWDKERPPIRTLVLRHNEATAQAWLATYEGSRWRINLGLRRTVEHFVEKMEPDRLATEGKADALRRAA